MKIELKKFLKRRRIGQRELSRMTGIHQPLISKLVNGDFSAYINIENCAIISITYTNDKVITLKNRNL